MDIKDGMISLGDLLMRGGVWSLMFMLPAREAMLGLTFLVAVNVMTGIWKAKHQGDGVHVIGLINALMRLIAYQVAITVTYVAEVIFFNGLPLTQVVAGIMAAKQLQSSLDNLHTVTGLDLWTNIKELFKKKVP